MKTFSLKSADLKIKCKVRKMKAAKKMTLSIQSEEEILLTIPRWVTYKSATDFLREKKDWILRHAEKIKKSGASSLMQIGDRSDYLQNKEKARKFVEDRIKHFNEIYNFEYKRIAIRDQKTRWGSCSGQGNLNFNYRIIFLTAEQANYLVVHELCHLGELNHSKRFWQLVEKAIPEYKEVSRDLRRL